MWTGHSGGWGDSRGVVKGGEAFADTFYGLDTMHLRDVEPVCADMFLRLSFVQNIMVKRHSDSE